jgi:spore coat protein U-like protein
MKNRRIQRAALGALFVAEALGVSGEVSANGRGSKMQVALTIENSCLVGTRPDNRDSAKPVSNLDHATQVTVECTTKATPYDVRLDTTTATGEPPARRSVTRPKAETAPSVVTLNVEF